MSDYWKKRKAQRMYEAMGEAEKTALDIAKVYAQSTTYLNSQIEGVFNKYKKKYGLSEKEARELLNKTIDKHSFNSMLEELRKGVPTNEKKELLSLLESSAYRYRINRLENIQKQIDDLVVNIYNKEKDISTKHYVDTAYAGYYKSVFDIQKSTGYAFSFNAIDPNAVDKLLNSKWSGENYSQRIWKNTQDLANELKDELMVSLLTGKSERDIANDLANRFNVGAYKARRLVRTESNFAYTEAEMMSYEECECDNYVFLATLDLVTSKICQSLDMKRFKLKDRQTGVNAPPMHAWCRSTTIAGIDDKALSQMKRSARDTKTGKTYKVPANQNYSQWLNNQQNKHGKDNVDVFRKKVLNLKKDQERFIQYKMVLGDGFIPDTLDKFQDIKYNDINTWGNLKNYVRSRSAGKISAFSTFDDYQKYKDIIDKEVIGLEARDGLVIKSQSKHFIERVLGTTVKEGPNKNIKREGVEIEDICEAILNTIDYKNKKTKEGVSRKYIGRKVEVSINPQTGNLIQVNPRKRRD